MSLDYSLTKIAEYKRVCYEVDKHPEADGFEGMFNRTRYTEDGVNYVMTWTTHTLIFAMMCLDVGTISAINIHTVWERMYIWEQLFGSFRQKTGGDGTRSPVYFTFKELEAHIGLTTNVSFKTDTAWRKRVMDQARRDAKAAETA